MATPNVEQEVSAEAVEEAFFEVYVSDKDGILGVFFVPISGRLWILWPGRWWMVCLSVSVVSL